MPANTIVCLFSDHDESVYDFGLVRLEERKHGVIAALLIKIAFLISRPAAGIRANKFSLSRLQAQISPA